MNSASFVLLSVESKVLLRKGGFVDAKEVLKLSAQDLSRELHIDLSKAHALLHELRGNNSNRVSKPSQSIRSCTELVSSSNAVVRNITTCCLALDKLLGGGFPRGCLSELCGAPGSGKTQMCMQVAVAATINQEFGGVEGSTLYLDTEGSFSPQRALDMAEAISKHLHTQMSQSALTATEILSSIHVFRAYDVGEVMGFIQSLPMLLKEFQLKVRVVVIDSLAHHFRHDFPDMQARNRLLAKAALLLNSVAQEFDVSVLVTNHMTTTTTTTTTKQQGLVPALGDAWFHGVTNRLILRKLEDVVYWEHHAVDSAYWGKVPVRVAELIKSSSLPCQSAEFVVTKIGLRQRPFEQDYHKRLRSIAEE